MSRAKRILAALVAAAVLLMGTAALAEDTKINISAGEDGADGTITVTISPVSYTHLTLPTKLEV